MPDRKKVIKGLECCAAMSGDECRECPYGYECRDTDSPYGMPHLAADALALLKEQEAVKPIHRCWNGRITQLNKINGYAFCPYCGKPVDWGENVLL